MEGNEVFASALWLALSVWLLVFSIRHVLLPAVITGFRHEVMTLRRKLFRLVNQGLVDPRQPEPAYVRLRLMMNGALQHAERLSFSRLVAASFLLRSKPKQPTISELTDRVENPELKQRLEAIIDELDNRVLTHVIATSPVAWMLIVFILLGLGGMWLIKGGPFRKLFAGIGRQAQPVAEAVSGAGGDGLDDDLLVAA